jgi:EAL domain-containing protein (putative c-di-GMP-specific phosphodiesterase class I)
VVDAALTEVTRWRQAGLAVTVNVNIGGQHLRSTSFAADLADLIGAHPEIPAGTLELEVAEEAGLADIAATSRIIEACRGQGVRFALDGFGNGRSSLSDLRHLRVDALNIHQSLIRDMLDNGEDQAMVEGIVGLGRAFRCQVVAKGVETAAHCAALINLGCVFGQGYGIARPMPAAEAFDWMCSRPTQSA